MTYFFKTFAPASKNGFHVDVPTAVADCCHSICWKAMFLFQAGRLKTGKQYLLESRLNTTKKRFNSTL